ncbi:MAG: zf-HC2 domain-containing protein [Vicinamibacteria bacterium]|nr:zf-HC2 domain-containing protein [Vicinamibacteria bacterium]
MALEPWLAGQRRDATAPISVETAPVDTLAYTCAYDLCGDETKALALARDLLKDVRKSRLKSPYAEALLRRLGLAEWTKRDRPRPTRLESSDPKESAILLFFLNAWGATYEDLGVALGASEDRARHLVHRARMEQIAALTRLPIPRSECRRPRELLSDYREGGLSEPLAEDVTQHLRDCRECSLVDFHLKTLLEAPSRPLIEAPLEIVGVRSTRPALSFSLEGVSRTQRRAGIVLLCLGVAMGAVELHPGLNAAASEQMDRMGATMSRWRSRGERLLEDLRVLKALAIGTVEGRTEELSQTLDDYVNSAPPADNDVQKNKAAPDAVLDSRDPKASPRDPGPEGPVNGPQSPKKP